MRPCYPHTPTGGYWRSGRRKNASLRPAWPGRIKSGEAAEQRPKMKAGPRSAFAGSFPASPQKAPKRIFRQTTGYLLCRVTPVGLALFLRRVQGASRGLATSRRAPRSFTRGSRWARASGPKAGRWPGSRQRGDGSGLQSSMSFEVRVTLGVVPRVTWVHGNTADFVVRTHRWAVIVPGVRRRICCMSRAGLLG